MGGGGERIGRWKWRDEVCRDDDRVEGWARRAGQMQLALPLAAPFMNRGSKKSREPGCTLCHARAQEHRCITE